MRAMIKRRSDRRGFTLIELMIATLVFSMVLLVLTAGIMEIGRVYYKGVASTRTQEVARSIADDIGRSVQFAGGTVIQTGSMPNNVNVRGFCVNNRRYSYIPSVQLSTAGQRKFVADTVASGCGSGTTPLSQGQMNNAAAFPGQELLGNGMRIVALQLTQSPADPSLYDLTIRVAFGDDGVLCSPSAGDCGATTTSTNLSNTDLQCKSSRLSSQFCAMTEIKTTVTKRI
jgi:prepilin-type N-terminal cleavage/methylation domain-containing protein